MERRAFLQKLGWSSLLLGAAPLRAFALPQISALDDFDPYVIDLNHQHIQGLLQTNSLPSMIRIDSISQTPSRQSWVKGEGLQGVDYAFDNALQRHNQRNMYYASSKCYTPATLLKTNTHPIFGQFFLNESETFCFGCIKGFDNAYYIVHPSFRRVFTYAYSCYGLPAQDYEAVWCTKCREMHIRQVFQKYCDNSYVTLYAWAECSSGGYHSFIKNYNPLQKCGVADDRLKVGSEY
jgi:hypothetical protein